MAKDNTQPTQPTRDEVREGAKQTLKDLLRKRIAASKAAATSDDGTQRATKPDVS